MSRSTEAYIVVESFCSDCDETWREVVDRIGGVDVVNVPFPLPQAENEIFADPCPRCGRPGGVYG